MSGARFTEAELKAKGWTPGAPGFWKHPKHGERFTEFALQYTPDKPKPITVKASTDNSPKYKSKLERRFAEEYLEIRKMTGESLDWKHEAIRFKLGTGAWYKPDFYEIQLDREMWILETKGYWRDAAKIRIKVAASSHPFRFFVVTWDGKAKHWNIEKVKV